MTPIAAGCVEWGVVCECRVVVGVSVMDGLISLADRRHEPLPPARADSTK